MPFAGTADVVGRLNTACAMCIQAAHNSPVSP